MSSWCLRPLKPITNRKPLPKSNQPPLPQKKSDQPTTQKKKKKKNETHEVEQCHRGGYRLGVCIRRREREDNKPSETLAMGSLDEIEESERWKLR